VDQPKGLDTYDIIANSVRPVKVIVRVDGDIPADIEAKCLFDFEVILRARSGLDIWVLKERMADDSKLRVITDMRRSKK
jgi:hypothetical protein